LFPAEQQPGVSHSGHERNHLFLSREGSQFIDISGISGLDDSSDGRAFALFDYDRDGWQDVAVVNANTPLLRLYRNQIGGASGTAPGNQFLAIRLVGGNQTAAVNSALSNRDGVGARVSIVLENQTLLREQSCGEGLSAQNSSTMLVGVGAVDVIPRVTVLWPSGREQSMEQIPVQSLITVFEDPSQSDNGAGYVVQDYLNPDLDSPPLPSSVSVSRKPKEASFSPAAIPGESALILYTTMATWCALCKGELPQFERLRSRFGGDQLAIHAVPIDPEDSQEKLLAYMARNTPAYSLLGNLGESEKRKLIDLLGRQLQIQSPLPASLVTNSKGHVLLSTVGVPSVSDIDRLLVHLATGED